MWRCFEEEGSGSGTTYRPQFESALRNLKMQRAAPWGLSALPFVARPAPRTTRRSWNSRKMVRTRIRWIFQAHLSSTRFPLSRDAPKNPCSGSAAKIGQERQMSKTQEQHELQNRVKNRCTVQAACCPMNEGSSNSLPLQSHC